MKRLFAAILCLCLLAEVTAVNIRSDGFDDRCALYLRVLNDLWAVDEGLNSDITMLSVDLSQTGLSDSEQAAVAWVFGGMHDISEVLSLSYEELAAEENLNQNTLAARVRRIKLRFQKIYREIENFSDPPCKKSDTARHKEKRGGSKL